MSEPSVRMGQLGITLKRFRPNFVFVAIIKISRHIPILVTIFKKKDDLYKNL